jgi:hypothetical protein
LFHPNPTSFIANVQPFLPSSPMALCLRKLTPQKRKTIIATTANLHSFIVKQQTTKQKGKGKLELEYPTKEQIEKIKQGRARNIG